MPLCIFAICEMIITSLYVTRVNSILEVEVHHCSAENLALIDRVRNSEKNRWFGKAETYRGRGNEHSQKETKEDNEREGSKGMRGAPYVAKRRQCSTP